MLFKDANLTILRFKNGYKYDEENDYDTKVEREYYEKAKERLNEDGLEPEVLMSSWSPAAYLKTSESLYGEGTIVKDKDGNYTHKFSITIPQIAAGGDYEIEFKTLGRIIDMYDYEFTYIDSSQMVG